MKKGIKVLILSISIIVILGTSSFLTYYFVFNPALFKPCVEKPFTYYPVDMNRLQAIIPLGNLNPPGHTYPTDHMYFITNNTQWQDGFEIFSPGNITIKRIIKVTYDPPQASGVREDYTVDFLVCSKISGTFGHINNISDFLSELTGEFGAEFGDAEDTYEIDGRIYTRYSKNTRIDVSAGQLLGKAGINGGFDFWLKDTRITHNWINKDISKSFQHTVCPLDYFTNELRSTLLSKLAYWSGQPVNPPGYCGRIAFDVSNTAQGIWRREGWRSHEAEEFGLALVYNNYNASEGAISIGNAGEFYWDKAVYNFSPENSGFLNRNFSQVKNDGNIYYYYCKNFNIGSDYYKVILIKMTSNQELVLQFIDSTTPLPEDPRSLFDINNTVKYIR